MPIRHGMTMGELARLYNEERKIGAELTVIAMDGWKRDYWYDDTGLGWINPSPNMRNLNQATLYPGIGAIEYSNISVGRGTDQPFEQIGAPWIDGPRLAAALNARRLAGIRFYPIAFTPKSSKYANEECQGVFMVITNRAALQPTRVGLEIVGALSSLFGEKYDLLNTWRLVGSAEILNARPAGRGSGGGGGALERRRSALAPSPGEVSFVSLTGGSEDPLVRSQRALSSIHLAIRLVDQRIEVHRIRRHRHDTDADVDAIRQAVDDRRLQEGLANLLGLVARIGFGGGEQHQEFVAAPAEHVVRLARELPQDRAHRLQHLVAGVVAALIVDRLEVIDVDVEQRQGQLVAPVVFELVLGDLVQQAAVVAARQRIGDRHGLHLVAAGGELGGGGAQFLDDILEDQQVHAEHQQRGRGELKYSDPRRRVADAAVGCRHGKGDGVHRHHAGDAQSRQQRADHALRPRDRQVEIAPCASHTLIITNAGATTARGPRNVAAAASTAWRSGSPHCNPRGTTAGARNHAPASRMPAPNTSAASAQVATARRPADTDSGPSARIGAARIEAEDQHHHAAGEPRRHAGEHVGPRAEQVQQEQRDRRGEHQQPDERADLQRHHRCGTHRGPIGLGDEGDGGNHDGDHGRRGSLAPFGSSGHI